MVPAKPKPSRKANLKAQLRRRKPHLTESQRWQILHEYNRKIASPEPPTQQTIVNNMCNEFNISKSTMYRIVKEGKKSTEKIDFSTRARCGRPPKLNNATDAALRASLIEHSFDASFQELGAAIGVHRTTVSRHAKQNGWRVVKSQLSPRLSEFQMSARLQWAKTHVKSHWTAWIDLDEKYFQTVSANRPLKIPPSTTPPKVDVQHKSHVPKVLMIAAIAKPSRLYNFDGKVGLWRVVEEVVAKRKSKNHEKGETYEKDCTMDCDKFFEIMTTKVFPAIRTQLSWAPRVVVQVDNAPPHAGKDTIARLNVEGAKAGAGVRIVVICQPAQSPDTNANDLGFFNSLQTRVEKRRGAGSAFDVEGLVERINSAWDEYPPELLKKIFATKTEVLKKIIGSQGDNQFKLEHSS